MSKSKVKALNRFCAYFQKCSINIFLFLLFCIAIAVVVIIQFDITDFKFKSNLCQEKIDKWNDIWLEFSYGYISGYILFVLTVILPYILNRRIIRKGIYLKMESISNILKSILRSFAENTGLSPTDFSENNIKRIFSLKDWNEKDKECKLLGINKTCIQACSIRNKRLLVEIDSLINTYKEYLSTDILPKLEEMRNSQFIINVNIYSACSPISIGTSAKEGLAEEFTKVIQLYNDIKTNTSAI